MQETAKQCKIDPFRVSNYSFNLRYVNIYFGFN